MSIKIMSKVWQSDLDSGSKMVLLALADASNDSGVCYPSLRSLERKTSLTKRTVLSKLKLLEEKGLLWKRERMRKNGIKSSNEYLLFPSENYDDLDAEIKEKWEGVAKEKPAFDAAESDGGGVAITPGGGVAITPRSEPSSISNRHSFNRKLPPNPQSEEKLPAKLREWIDYRKQIRKPIQQPTIYKLLKDHQADPEGFAIKVDHSIANGYQGLFSPKSSAPPTGSASPPSPQTFADCKSALRSFAAHGGHRKWSVIFEGREVKLSDQGVPYHPDTVEDLDFATAGRFYKWLMRNWHLIDGSSQSGNTADAVSQLAERMRV
jgi:hypothetical protein